MAFHVGITGHRALPEADVEALQAEAARQFRAIRTEVLRLHERDRTSASPLYQPAPPALRCVCGLAEGSDMILAEAALAEGWDLVAVLPFARDEFEHDFAAGPVLDHFRALLARAAVVSELDGVRGRGGEPYAFVGQQIVEQSDLMLVVWDGLPPRGPGGTGDVVQQAIDRGLPVAILPPASPVVVQWRGGGDLATRLHAELLPPADAAGFPQAYYREAPRGRGWAGAAVRWYEHAVLAGVGAADTPASAAPMPTAESPLREYFVPADRLATEYAARYRAAGLMRYGLIIPATFGAFIADYGPDWVRAGGFVLQFVALIAVLTFSTSGRWERTRERFVAYRALAEYLRSASLLAPFGAVAKPPEVAPLQAKGADWTVWYGHAAIRSVGLTSRRIDPAAIAAAVALLRAETQGQIAFLLGRAARFTAIARRLRHIGVGLFLCGLAIEVVRAGFILGGAGDRPILWFNELSLVLPALAPVFLGLLGFGEYLRLATRYQAVAAELRAQLAALDQAEPGRAAALRIARRIAEVMLVEGADWQMLIKARGLSAY